MCVRFGVCVVWCGLLVCVCVLVCACVCVCVRARARSGMVWVCVSRGVLEVGGGGGYLRNRALGRLWICW